MAGAARSSALSRARARFSGSRAIRLVFVPVLDCEEPGDAMRVEKHSVFVTGVTGYLARPLISTLTQRGHDVRALTRPGSQTKLPAGCQAVLGNAFNNSSYREQIPPAETFLQLVGVSHPNPSKAAQLRSVDLASATGAIKSAVDAGVQHFVYLSVAHPAPMMKAYIESKDSVRDADPRKQNECHDPAPLVHPRPRTSLALRAVTDVLAHGASSAHARGRSTPWTGDS